MFRQNNPRKKLTFPIEAITNRFKRKSFQQVKSKTLEKNLLSFFHLEAFHLSNSFETTLLDRIVQDGEFALP
jgi:hypothetical protein